MNETAILIAFELGNLWQLVDYNSRCRLMDATHNGSQLPGLIQQWAHEFDATIPRVACEDLNAYADYCAYLNNYTLDKFAKLKLAAGL